MTKTLLFLTLMLVAPVSGCDKKPTYTCLNYREGQTTEEGTGISLKRICFDTRYTWFEYYPKENK